ncbi:unnamed protein product [Closterium sp. Yama58-4]|nr:unnamed protein product [Closterium sp. Yama58-4]
MTSAPPVVAVNRIIIILRPPSLPCSAVHGVSIEQRKLYLVHMTPAQHHHASSSGCEVHIPSVLRPPSSPCSARLPKRWKGACTGLSRCNRKLIGARYFLKGYEAEYGKLARGEFRSARDAGGHGTWCAGAAAGNAGVVLTDEFGSTAGPASGMAPRGRLAVYKAIWFNASEGYGHDCDIFAAVDQAVADGVDVLSMSIGSGEDTYFGDLPLLRAVQAGVFLAMAAGNEGPPPMAVKPYGFRTLSNAAPFYLTVAASSTDNDWGFFGRSAQSAESTQVNGTSLPASAAAVQHLRLLLQLPPRW